MLINQNTAISSSSILLVPYSTSHVLTYHEWMKDTEIQQLTASEPLSLEEEYAMQKSWRTDVDKLTFIACLPLPPNSEIGIGNQRVNVVAGEEKIVGDVNLFLSLPEMNDGDEDEEEGDEEEEICTGELELMIADPSCRRKGYGRGAILTFLMFIERNLDQILEEFMSGDTTTTTTTTAAAAAGGGKKGKGRGLRLRVKIGGENEKSIGLFEGLGFERIGEGVNYFGECELRFGRVLSVGSAFDGEEGGMEGLGSRFGVVGYRELEYVEVDEGKGGVLRVR